MESCHNYVRIFASEIGLCIHLWLHAWARVIGTHWDKSLKKIGHCPYKQADIHIGANNFFKYKLFFYHEKDRKGHPKVQVLFSRRAFQPAVLRTEHAHFRSHVTRPDVICCDHNKNGVWLSWWKCTFKFKLFCSVKTAVGSLESRAIGQVTTQYYAALIAWDNCSL